MNIPCCTEVSGVFDIFSKSSWIDAEEREEDLVVVRAHKNSPQTTVGIHLGVDLDARQLFVENILESSIFYATDLKAGMDIKSINNFDAECKSALEMTQIMDKAERFVEIRARNNKRRRKPSVLRGQSSGEILFLASKMSQDQMVGIRLEQGLVQKDSIVVGSVSGTSPFYTHLLPGMQILSINGVKAIGLPIQQISEVVRKAEKSVSIVAKTPDTSTLDWGRTPIRTKSGRAPDAYVYKVQKLSRNTKVGLHIRDDPVRDDPNSSIVVIAVDSTGLFAGTRTLKPGMIVTKFQGYPTSHISAADLGALLKETAGTITIEMILPQASGQWL